MDDFYIICSDKRKLQCILRDVRALMDSYGLELNQKTAIFPLRNGIDFLGFHSYLTDTGAVIQKLRRDSSKRMKNKIKYWETAYPAGEATKQEILRSFDAWDAHAAHGDTYSLRRQYADRLEKLLECKIPIHRKINSNKLARDRRRARQCRCIYKKQHKALSLSVSQNTRCGDHAVGLNENKGGNEWTNVKTGHKKPLAALSKSRSTARPKILLLCSRQPEHQHL